ncbi:Retrovirus-related Pol polyprotein from transposon 17.6 [Vitis vinifera]|uniref:Retrovirus-related Pol polyprotein from transposon 17.6 n=1 Tax=Vitis vinifera TaxID=29760 RepID=A0A438H9E2_VITVI|nr:Retrovirus-related Pol polyprotein from transposon 17.6 [Vitis vinifera]
MINSMSVGKDTWKPLMLVLTMALILGYCYDRRVEELELKKMNKVQVISETQAHVMPCTICQSCDHVVDESQPSSAINSQLHQKIENVESSQIKRMDGIQNDLSQKIDNIQYSISRLNNLNTVNEKGKFPSQPSQNPKGVHKVETQDGESSKLREVKAVITLRSGKEVDQPLPKWGKMKNSCQGDPCFTWKEEIKNSSEILEDLCTVKRGLHVTKNAFLTEQVSAIIQTTGTWRIEAHSHHLSLADRKKLCANHPGRPFLATSNAIIIVGMGGELERKPGVLEDGFLNPLMCLAIMSPWRRREEILPLFNKEDSQEKDDEKCPVVVSSTLTSDQEDSLLGVLRKFKKAIGWQISDLKGISPLVCTHHIYMEEDAKPVRHPEEAESSHARGDGYQGYFQIEIDLEDQEKTTFTCPFGTFAYRRMPFGLFVLQKCIEKDLVLNWEKCHFMVQQGIVLGHIISKNGIEVDKAKVELIVKLPPPTNVKGIRQFLGHVGFYRRMPSLCGMRNVKKSFEELKQFLTTAPIVRGPNWKLPFEVICDASDLAMGAILGQREDGKPYVIYYASKTLNEAQRNYTTTEKELLQ